MRPPEPDSLPPAIFKSCTFIVTRARHQNQELIKKISALGGVALAWPCVRVNYIDTAALADALNQDLAWADSVIFTSANAIDGAKALLDNLKSLQKLTLYTTGKSSQLRLMRAVPLAQVHSPHRHQGARGLAQMPELTNISGRRFLLIRGETSLGNILPWLVARGAQVREAIVYQIASIHPSLPEDSTDINSDRKYIVLISSISALTGLTEAIAQTPWSGLLRQSGLLAASARIAAQAEEMGWRQVYSSPEPDDESLIQSAGSLVLAGNIP